MLFNRHALKAAQATATTMWRGFSSSSRVASRLLSSAGLSNPRRRPLGMMRIQQQQQVKHIPFRTFASEASTSSGTSDDGAEPVAAEDETPAGPTAHAKEGSARSRHSFQAETSQLLDIVSRSLYTDKEVFIRELISNASDALEKVRHRSVSGEPVVDESAELQISITVDPENRTITIQDTGIGLSEDELHECLGTIAKSGTKAFMQAAAQAGAGANSSIGESLIGQFGVGFYSAFMVADQVDVFSKSADPEQAARLWSSQGVGDYEVTEAEDVPRGSTIVIKLREDCAEFADAAHVRSVIKKYSNFVNFPILVNGERVNTVQALWAMSKNSVTEDQYTEFYRYIANAFDEPRSVMHFSADAPISLQALFFVGQTHMEKYGMGRMEPNHSLYSRKVLIEGKSKSLLPDFLRFVHGVVDSEDIPLNISRESMQDSALVRKISNVITKRLLKHFADEAKKDPEEYVGFFREYGQFLKEGVCTHFDYRDELAKLLRFNSSSIEENELTSLDEYITRLTPAQDKIYYLVAPDRATALASAYYEVFQKEQVEVLILTSPIDDFVMSNLRSYNKRDIVDAESGNLDFLEDQKEDDAPAADGGAGPLSAEDQEVLAKFMKDTLGDKVKAVKVTKRLVGSPAVITGHESASLRRMNQFVQHAGDAAGGMDDIYGRTQVLEINPNHPIIRGLWEQVARDQSLTAATAGEEEEQVVEVGEPAQSEAGDEAAAPPAVEGVAPIIVNQLFDNALITAGLVDDPRRMLGQLNDLMLAALDGKAVSK